MRKVLVVATIAAVAVGLLAWAVTRGMTSVPAGQWPLGLGRVREVPKHFPAGPANAAAEQLWRLALPMSIDFHEMRYAPPPADELRAYMLAQAARRDATIDPPPPEVAAALAKHEVALAAVREHLVRSEPLRWALDLDSVTMRVPNTQAHLTLNRLLIASALDRARRGDARAWDDLHAAWKLSRSLLERPEIPSVLVGFSIARILNAVARKMPLPEPPWLAEVRTFDYRRALVAAQQADAWVVLQYMKAPRQAPPSSPSGVLRSVAGLVTEPYYRLCAADFLESLRLSSVQLAETRECAFDVGVFRSKQEKSVAPWNTYGKMAMANYGPLWARLFRFRAELETTERANALRAGRILPKTSSCSDGQWVYDANGVHFSPDIAEPDDVIVPLAFQGGQLAVDGAGGGAPAR